MPLSYPRIWPFVLGQSADLSDLPDTADTTKGQATIRDIFPAITQLPLRAGGIAPKRNDFNALFHLLGENIFFQQNGGQYTWSAEQDYYEGAIITHDGIWWRSIKDSGPTSTIGAKEPGVEANSSVWERVIPDITKYDANLSEIARILDRMTGTDYTGAGALNPAALAAALAKLLTAVSAVAFLNKSNVFTKPQQMQGTLPEENNGDYLVRVKDLATLQSGVQAELINSDDEDHSAVGTLFLTPALHESGSGGNPTGSGGVTLMETVPDDWTTIDDGSAVLTPQVDTADFSARKNNQPQP